MVLSLNNLSKTFGNIRAVDNLNTQLHSGVYGLLGANGAGKSTLMEMLSTLQLPTTGDITWNGKSIYTMADDYRNDMGYLPQQFNCYPNFTTYEFLNYIAILKGMDKKLADKSTHKALEIVNLNDRKNIKTKNLSGGMKQRLGIAQALINDPKVLILDEPTAGLDPEERVKFRTLISTLSKDKIVILSTHIVSDIEYIAKEILIMKRGSLLLRGTPNNIVNSLKGQVWESHVSESELENLTEDIIVSNIRRGSQKEIILRYISSNQKLRGATTVTPTIEDVYLYYFVNPTKQ